MEQQQLLLNSRAASAAADAAAKQAADAMPPVFPREIFAPPTGLNVRKLPLGSLPRTLVTAIDTSCSVPDCKVKFSSTEPAFSAFCPHLFCTDHAKPMTRYFKGETEIGFDCSSCRTPFERINSKDHPNGYFWRENRLAKHYVHLEETAGFRCFVCSKLHPRLNMVECCTNDCKTVAAAQQKQLQHRASSTNGASTSTAVEYWVSRQVAERADASSSSSEQRAAAAAAAAAAARLSCVWCACAAHSTCYMRMIPIDREPSSRSVDRERLNSFDWNYPDAWSLLHCGACWDLLVTIEEHPWSLMDEGFVPFHVWMACQHSTCLPKGHGPCGFCTVGERLNDVDKGKLSTKSYLDDEYKSILPRFLHTCEGCQLLHPKANFPPNDYKYCVWCKLTANAKFVKECEVFQELKAGTNARESGKGNAD